MANWVLVQSHSRRAGPETLQLARQPIRSASFWSETIKLRLAGQVERIRHWTIIEGSWEQAPDTKAHWHVDPPYNGTSGRRYRYNSIDRASLANWCNRRRGFVQVCENDGATWLRFEPLSISYTHRARGYWFTRSMRWRTESRMILENPATQLLGQSLETR